MGVADKKDIVLVVDLDDTLYSEYDFQTSGIKEVGKVITELYGKEITEKMLMWRDEGERDIWDRACQLLELPLSVKESLLWIYRLHRPAITMNTLTSDTISQIKFLVKEVVILSDGRSVSQRKKINALGLHDLRAYISEEHCSEKPDPARFLMIMREIPARRYLYVADNPKKDFVAPNALGWKTLGLHGNSNNIHSQTTDGLPSSALPHLWVHCFSEIIEILDNLDP